VGSSGSSTGSARLPFPVVVIGTRAQLVKMAPVLRELEEREIAFRLIFTGQHLVTMQELLDEFKVHAKPIWLGRRREIDTLGRMLPWFMASLWRLVTRGRKLLRSEPGAHRALVIVHGDTMSTLLGAMAGKLNRCRVAHIESGLRSFSLRDPFPEELTRVLVFQLIDVAFCPGRWAMDNMSRYRVERVNTGSNTLLDSVRLAIREDQRGPRPSDQRPSCVASIHRHENLSSRTRLNWILATIMDIAGTHDVDFVLHPSTMARLKRTGQIKELNDTPGIYLRERMGYVEFLNLMADADFVLTDGGSNQEELSYLGIPTLLARQRTERMEGLGLNAEMIEPQEGHSAWRDTLGRIRDRQTATRASIPESTPSRVIVDWLEYGTASRPL